MTALAVHSRISGVDWPGLPTGSGANLLTLLYQFEKSEWWNEAELKAQQFRQLTSLLNHAFETVPYY